MFNVKKLGLKASVAALAFSTLATPQGALAQPDPYLGQLTLYPYNFCPRGWTEASGQLLAINSYTALFSLLGTNYGGDGRTTFGLPDLRGRVPVGIGNGPGLTNIPLAQVGGRESFVQSTVQMAPHTHTATTDVNVDAQLRGFSSRAGNSGTAANNVPSTTTEAIYNAGPADTNMGTSAITTTSSATTTVNSAGGGQSINIRNPYLGLRWCIALQGVYPSRN